MVHFLLRDMKYIYISRKKKQTEKSRLIKLQVKVIRNLIKMFSSHGLQNAVSEYLQINNHTLRQEDTNNVIIQFSLRR